MQSSASVRPATTIRRWVGRRLLSTTAGRRSGLLGVSVLPKKLTMPLRRDGLDPLPELGQLRAAEPVTKLKRVLGLDVWLVSGFDEVRSVLSDGSSYSTDIRAILGAGSEGTLGGLGFTDPPDHTRLRKYLTPEFTGRRLAGMLPRIERIVADRIAALRAAPGETVDLVPEFAFPIPFFVICELLGLPVEDRERFRLLGHARFDVNGGGAGTFGAMSESREFLTEAVRAQRANPGDGLLGALITEHGDELSDEELAGLADGVFTGGYETSASMLALGAVTLLRDPDAMALIAKDETAIDGIVDELLRYLSVVQIAFPRVARHDLTLFGKTIKAGDVVACSLSAANRDVVFGAGPGASDPDFFDPRRVAPTNLAFGYGFHRCIGSELAKLELRTAFRALAQAFPDMELAADPADLRFRGLSIVYGVESVPVRLNRP